jgi:hypothetical protein
MSMSATAATGAASAFPATRANAARSPARLAAGLLLGQFAAMWGAFFILAPSINWPASLGEPASAILPLILEQAGPVFAGYGLYMLHALLLIPLAILLRQALPMSPVLGATTLTLGVLAGLAKSIGIARWLFLMPHLAAGYVDPTTTETTRAAIAVVYEAFNAYAGGIGEILGVGLFAGLWTTFLSISLLRVGSGARLMALTGFAAAGLLFATLPSVVGLESPILLTLSGIVWQLWTAALAIRLLRAR